MSEEPQPTAAEAPVETPAEAPAEQPYSEYPAAEAPAAEEAQPQRGIKGLMSKKFLKIPVFAIIGIIILLLIGAAVGSSGVMTKKAATAPTKMVSLSGSYDVARPQVLVGQTDSVPISFNSTDNSSEVTNVYEVTVAFSWTDDYAGSQPDEMKFELVSPDGQNKSADTQGTSGAATLNITAHNVTDKKMDDNTKGWEMRATCVKAGGKKVGPIGFLIYVDKGNNYSAKIEYKYYGHQTSKKATTK
jgi:hypothetical protein